MRGEISVFLSALYASEATMKLCPHIPGWKTGNSNAFIPFDADDK